MNKTQQAVKLVLEDGLSQGAAAKAAGVDRAAVSRALSKVANGRTYQCPCCGHEKKVWDITPPSAKDIAGQYK